MQISATINLGPDDSASDLAGDARELAEAILKAVGGDEDKDTCNVSISGSGYAGPPPMGTP